MNTQFNYYKSGIDIVIGTFALYGFIQLNKNIYNYIYPREEKDNNCIC